VQKKAVAVAVEVAAAKAEVTRKSRKGNKSKTLQVRPRPRKAEQLSKFLFRPFFYARLQHATKLVFFMPWPFYKLVMSGFVAPGENA